MPESPWNILPQDSIVPTLEEISAQVASLSREELLECLYSNLLVSSEWRRIVEEFNDGIYIADASGVGIYVNEAYRKISGLKQEEIQGLSAEDLENKHYIDKSCIVRVLKYKRAMTVDSYFYRTGKTCVVSCKPVLDKEGNIILTIGSIRDMTEIYSLREEQVRNKSLLERYKAEAENLRQQLFCNENLIAEDPAMINVLRSVQKVAATDSTVMIMGETGVGKEEIAKYIHENSPRKGSQFIKINCGAIAESLFESELFGYESGAFTGAKQGGKKGLFEVADKGTIFLDEISEIPLTTQAKLLRTLQEREIMRVGGVKPIQIDVRVISATNRDLWKMVEEGKFRIDLYYRLNVVPVNIPPLRERPGDLMPLAEHFLKEFNKKYHDQKVFSEASKLAIREYDWPGNIRELRNIIERAMIIGEGNELDLMDIDTQRFRVDGQSLSPSVGFSLEERVRRIEYTYMESAYLKCGNMKDAAAFVGMKKSTFAGKFKIYREMYGKEE